MPLSCTPKPSLRLEVLEAREVPAGIVSVFASNASFLNTGQPRHHRR